MKYFLSSLNYYRVFDVGEEINLTTLSNRILKEEGSVSRFSLKKVNRSLFVNEAPLLLSIGELDFQEQKIQAFVKIWNFGAISLMFKFSYATEMTIEEIKEKAIHIEKSPELLNLAKEKVLQITQRFSDFIQSPKLANTYEDYLIFNFLDPDKKLSRDKFSHNHEIFALLLLEKSKISPFVIDKMQKDIYQYGERDLVILDWNSALILEEHTEDTDLADVIEFSLTQMLEMQYYDDLLDNRTNALYQSLKKKKYSLLSNRYGELSEEAASVYLETSAVMEAIQNSLKVVGYYYYA